MHNKKQVTLVIILLSIFPLLTGFFGQSSWQQRWWQRNRTQAPHEQFTTLSQNTGPSLEIIFTAGRTHNHPLMAFWLEDTNGRFLHSLYVAESIARGYFRHGNASAGRWQPGPLRRPAALPYWGHQRGIKAPDGYYIPTRESPMPDAVTGATPGASFVLTTRARSAEPKVLHVMMEINQSWDWNRHWHNNRFPDDPEYKTSSQPALVYRAIINLDAVDKEFTMVPIGHSHWSGATGELFDDLSTITTALHIAEEIKVRVVED